MMDPSNVIIHCPNGHQLQAARMDLDKPLACPICNVTFTPSPGGSMGAAPGGQPLELGYSGTPLSEPVDYPAYTNWMLGLWALAAFLVIGLSVYGAAVSSEAAAGQVPSSARTGVACSLCAVFAACAAAAILHLMWIYRIHRDARRIQKQETISPGLALGLSFIPCFNFAWSAWTMRKLALMSATEQDAPPRARAAVKATTACFVFGILLMLWSLLSIGIANYSGSQEGAPLGEQQADQHMDQERSAEILPDPVKYVITSLVIIAVGTYIWAVQKLEAALYPFLEAALR